MKEIPGKRMVLAVHGDGQLRRIEEPMPEVGPGMVLVKVKASLVSPGSELGGGWEALRQLQLNPEDRPPKRIGYSNSGLVLKCGSDVNKVTVGESVCCIGNAYAQHADYVVVPQNMVVPLPDGVSFEQATYGMLMATAMQALRRGNPGFGEFAAVAALGLVGLLTARLFQLAGCRVIGWDLNSSRLSHARKLGIEYTVNVGEEDAVERTREFTGGQGLDHGVIALGGNAEIAYDALMASMKVSPDGHPMGNIIIVGGAEFPYKKNLSNVNVIRSSRTGPGYHDKAWERGSDYPSVHVRWNTRNNLELCLQLIADRQVDVDTLTSQVVSFEEVEEETAELTRTPGDILGMVFRMA